MSIGEGIGPTLRGFWRQVDARIAPIWIDLCEPARSDDERRFVFRPAKECDYVLGAAPGCVEREEFSFMEEAGMVAAETKSLADQVQLDASVVPVLDEIMQGRGWLGDPFQGCLTLFEVNDAAVVGIDHAEVP